MTPSRKPLIAVAALALAGVAWFSYARFVRSAGPPVVQGWIEAHMGVRSTS